MNMITVASPGKPVHLDPGEAAACAARMGIHPTEVRGVRHVDDGTVVKTHDGAEYLLVPPGSQTAGGQQGILFYAPPTGKEIPKNLKIPVYIDAHAVAQTRADTAERWTMADLDLAAAQATGVPARTGDGRRGPDGVVRVAPFAAWFEDPAPKDPVVAWIVWGLIAEENRLRRTDAAARIVEARTCREIMRQWLQCPLEVLAL